MNLEFLRQCEGFEWDSGNLHKNWLRHGVSNIECEQCFFNSPFIVAHDEKHSLTEQRYYALGHTNLHRPLFLAFTIRDQKIRIISARDMSVKERKIYYEKAQD